MTDLPAEPTTEERLTAHVDSITRMLEVRGWRPSRGHMEDARKYLRQAAKHICSLTAAKEAAEKHRTELCETIRMLKDTAERLTDECAELHIAKSAAEEELSQMRSHIRARERIMSELEGQVEVLRKALDAVKRFGELACVDAGSPRYTGGKKPMSKDVWQFPRHLLTDIDCALAATAPKEGET
jgi:predicted RNase H-like nuclease (RuvC/YqgF family)